MMNIKPGQKYLVISAGLFLVLIIVIIVMNRVMKRTITVREIIVQVDSLDDINDIEGSLVIPYVYENVTMLSKLNLKERKSKFVDVILPAILNVRYKLLQKEKKVKSILADTEEGDKLAQEDSLYIYDLMKEYRVEKPDELLLAIHPHPASIALAQAALESGWGSSRFFKEANNIFGIWSFNKDEPRIRAVFSRGAKAVYLKKYDNLMLSVKDYFKVIGKGRVYGDFRRKRIQTDNVFELIWYLKYYSEKRSQYVILLRNVIVANDFTSYDHYVIHPDYFEYIYND